MQTLPPQLWRGQNPGHFPSPHQSSGRISGNRFIGAISEVIVCYRQSRNIFPLLDVTLATLDCPPCATWTETSQCLQGSTRSDVLGFYKIPLQIQWHLTCWIPRGHSYLPRTDQGVAVHEVLLCFCLNCFIYFFHRSFYPTDQSKSAEMLTSLLKVCCMVRRLLK